MTNQQRSSSSLFCGRPSGAVRHGQGHPLFDVVRPAFPLLTTTSPALQGSLKDGFEQAVVACSIPYPCEFPSLDSCQKRFLWAHEELELARHPVVGLVLLLGDAEKFPETVCLESMLFCCCFFSESASTATLEI